MAEFKIKTDFVPKGDQPKAIEELSNNLEQGVGSQVLLGVTGSGKTFTMANVIARLNCPTLVIAHNKTLAAQLYAEFKGLFPENAVEYFVSYYDYYQPEAYIPKTDTYIEKDSSINEEIDKMRHAATYALLERNDVIIVASVSCIYGLGSPEAYHGMLLQAEVGQERDRDEVLKKLVEIRYERNDLDFHRGTFRVRGDVVEIFPPYEEDRAVRIEFFGDTIDSISEVDSLRGKIIKKLEKTAIYPGSHYVTPEDQLKRAIENIRIELQERIAHFRRENKLLEAQRIEQRTLFDIEMLEEMGHCSGIENYSRHLSGRQPGDPPPTLLDYFPKNFIMFIDESHATAPQIGGMYRGDRTRKETLVGYGFRLPSALDNRPLTFEEFNKRLSRVVYVSATPADYEMKKSGGLVVEQIIRPTGLIDPAIEVRPAKNQVDDCLSEIRERTGIGDRILVTTLTKRMAEDLTDYYQNVGVRCKYLHSDIHTLERFDIIRELRMGQFDVLIGINLLREGLDIPEVSLVAILDADKEGFLRGERALIQTIGRTARNVRGKVILYADTLTRSMKIAIDETDRRRHIQEQFNRENNITPETVIKSIQAIRESVYEQDYITVPTEIEEEEKLLSEGKLHKLLEKLRKDMKKAANDLEFEKAAAIRDRIKELEQLEVVLG